MNISAYNTGLKFRMNKLNSNVIQKVNNIGKSKNLKQLKKVSEQMESLFVKQILDAMRKNVLKGGLINKSRGQKIFEDMLYTKYSEIMSKKSDFGIAKEIYNRYSKIV